MKLSNTNNQSLPVLVPIAIGMYGSLSQKAFRGELFARDLNNEPASMVLERIKEEKVQIKAEEKGGKSKQYLIKEPSEKIAAESSVPYDKNTK